MGVTLGFEGLLQDQVAISMVRDHNVLVAGAGPDGESARVVHVEFARGHHIQVELVRGKFRWGEFDYWSW